MTRLIDADALKEDVGSWGMNDYEPADFIDAIDNAPTVEPFERIGSICEENCGYRPQGEWITRHKLNSFGQDVVCFECNKCGEYKVPLYHLLITEPLKVCPNCGVNMQKGGAE